jgi:hypothetical protein
MKIFITSSLFLASLFLLILAPVWTGSSPGEETPAQGGTLAGIQGVYVYVEPLDTDVENKGVTHKVISSEVELRLRRAGINVIRYESPDSIPGTPTLYVQVNALADEYIEQCSYAIRLELTQVVHLERNSGLAPFHAPTWGVGGIGIHLKGWRRALIDDVISYVDQFIDDYYLANPDLTE